MRWNAGSHTLQVAGLAQPDSSQQRHALLHLGRGHHDPCAQEICPHQSALLALGVHPGVLNQLPRTPKPPSAYPATDHQYPDRGDRRRDSATRQGGAQHFGTDSGGIPRRRTTHPFRTPPKGRVRPQPTRKNHRRVKLAATSHHI